MRNKGYRLVDATAGGGYLFDVINSRIVSVGMIYQKYDQDISTVYKTFTFWNTEYFYPMNFVKPFQNFGSSVLFFALIGLFITCFY